MVIGGNSSWFTINASRIRRISSSLTLTLLLSIPALVLFWPTWISMAGRWSNMGGVYSHAYPLLTIAFLITALRLPLILSVRESPRHYVLAALALGAALVIWLIALVGLVEIGHQVMLPVVLWLIVFCSVGWRAVSLLWCPFLLLLLCIPLWDYLSPLLQQLTAQASYILLIPFGIPLRLTQTTILIPSGTITVADACSGIGFLLSFVALGAVYCTFNKISGRGLWIVLGSSIAFGVVSNWIRVAALVLIAHYSGMQSELIRHHTNFGWALFFGFFFVAQFMWRHIPVVIPITRGNVDSQKINPGYVFAILLLVAMVTGFYRLDTQFSAASIAPEQSVENRAEKFGWSLTPEKPDSWMRAFEGYTYGMQLVNTHWPAITATLLRYEYQASGRKLIGSNLNVFAGNGWVLESQRSFRDDDVQELIVAKGLERRIARFHYEVGGYHTANPLTAKLHFVWRRLRGLQDSGFIMVSARCVWDCAVERSLVEQSLLAVDALYGNIFEEQR